MTTLNYGLIGAGMMGQEHLQNIALLPDTKVTAVYEPNDDMAARAQRIAPHARATTSIADLLATSDLDALVVATPNYLHVPHFQEIAATRPLPLLMEKPLFTDPDDLARVQSLGATYPAPIWVAMEYRYMPPVAKFIEEANKVSGGIKMLTIREHRFPFLEKVNNWNRFNVQTGGTLVEKCCHFFDLMRLILKSEPTRIMASAGQDVNHLDEHYDGSPADMLDNAYVIVDFASGARAMLELCMFAEGSRYQEELCVVGSAGKLECLVPGPGRFWPSELGKPPVSQLIFSPREPKRPRTIEVPVDDTLLHAGDHNGSTFFQHQRFNEVVRGERLVPDVSLMDGARAVEMGLAAQRSAREGVVVSL